MTDTTTYTRLWHYVPDSMDVSEVTLDAPTFVPADARHVSRILGAAGLPRAQSKRGSCYTFGFNVSANHVNIHQVNYRGTDTPEALALMEQAVQILRDKGFTVVAGKTSADVFNRQDEFAWNSLHLGVVYVAVGDALVMADGIPAFKAEQARRHQEALQQKAQRDQEAKDRAALMEEIANGAMASIDQISKDESFDKDDHKAFCRVLIRRLQTEVQA